jgi:hypothetical protein
MVAAVARHKAQRGRGCAAIPWGMLFDLMECGFFASCRRLKLSTSCVASENHDAYCVSDSYRKRHKVDTQSLQKYKKICVLTTCK